MTPPAAASWVAWPVLAPLAGAALSFLAPRLGVGVGLPASAAVILCSGGMIWQVHAHGPQRVLLGGWGAPLGIELSADGLSAWMVGLTALVGAAVSAHAAGHFAGEPGHDKAHERRSFWPLWLFLWAGLNALFLSADVFNLYITLELVGFSAAALTALEGKREALSAAMRYLLASLIGSLFFLFGVALLYRRYATVDLALLAQAARPDPVTRAAPALMTAGLLLKGALFPLHTWLPPAHSSAAAPVSALLSALVVKAPFYIVARLWLVSFAAVRTAHVDRVLGLLGAAALIWGSVLALRQGRLKLVVAYSTVAQLGYLYLLFPLAPGAAIGFPAWSGVMLVAVSHGLAKAALFLAAGNAAYALGHDDIARMAGLARAAPRSVAAMALAAVALIGLPPSGAFIGKWFLFHAAIRQNQWGWVAVLAAGTALSIGYLVRVLDRTLAEPPELPRLRRVPAIMDWAALAAALLAAILGLLVARPLELLRAGAPVGPPPAEGAP